MQSAAQQGAGLVAAAHGQHLDLHAQIWVERQENNMHISYKPLWHTLLERDMRKEDLRLAAGMTTNMIANMSKEGICISLYDKFLAVIEENTNYRFRMAV